jgi:hypothetical protein
LREKLPAFQPTKLPSSSGSSSLGPADEGTKVIGNISKRSLNKYHIPENLIITNTVVRIPNAAAIFLLAEEQTVHEGYAGVCYTLLLPSHPQTSHHSYTIHHFQIIIARINMNCE